MYISFRFFTPETRIFYITTCSFAHKTALSWYSNRTRCKQRMEEYDQKANNDNVNTSAIPGSSKSKKYD